MVLSSNRKKVTKSIILNKNKKIGIEVILNRISRKFKAESIRKYS